MCTDPYCWFKWHWYHVTWMDKIGPTSLIFLLFKTVRCVGMVTGLSYYSNSFSGSARGISWFSPYLWHHKLLLFIFSYAQNHSVYITMRMTLQTTECKPVPTMPSMDLLWAIVSTLKPWYLFTVARKYRFCDSNGTTDASICYAAMVTKCKCRRNHRQAQWWEEHCWTGCHFQRTRMRKYHPQHCYWQPQDKTFGALAVPSKVFTTEEIHASSTGRT